MTDVSQAAAFKAFSDKESPKACLFYQPGDDPSSHLLRLLPTLQQDFPAVSLGSVDVSKASRCLIENQHVQRTPTVVFSWGSRQLGSLVGIDVPVLVSCLKDLSAAGSAAAAAPLLQQQLGLKTETPEELQQRLSLLVKRHPVMLFMKGQRDSPYCRFSKEILALLQQQGVTQFDTFDVFQDQAVREGLKKFSDWPTYPQLYVNGELLGGVDAVKAMIADGTFKDALPPSAFA